MKKKLIKIFDYVFITRPILFFPGWTTMLLGYLEVQGSGKKIFVNYYPSSLLFGAFVVFATAMGASFILNQVADAETDGINDKCFFIGREMIARRIAFYYAFFLMVAAVAGSLYINSDFLSGILVFILLTGYLYNFAPFVFKNKVWCGLIANFFMGWIAFYLGWVLWQPVTHLFFIKSFSFVLLNLALYIFTTLPDTEGDKHSGKITVGVLWGVQKSIYAAVIIFIIGLVWGIFIKDNLVLAVYVGSIVHFARVFYYPTAAETVKTTKWVLFLYSIVAGLFFPWYFILIIGAYFFTRAYYRNRFGINYPSFGHE